MKKTILLLVLILIGVATGMVNAEKFSLLDDGYTSNTLIAAQEDSKWIANKNPGYSGVGPYDFSYVLIDKAYSYLPAYKLNEITNCRFDFKLKDGKLEGDSFSFYWIEKGFFNMATADFSKISEENLNEWTRTQNFCTLDNSVKMWQTVPGKYGEFFTWSELVNIHGDANVDGVMIGFFDYYSDYSIDNVRINTAEWRVTKPDNVVRNVRTLKVPKIKTIIEKIKGSKKILV